MIQKILSVVLLVLLALSLVAGNVYAQAINPYAPTNAVGAEPMTPYNLWDIPERSRTEYLPCPTCGPQSAQLPDLPPVWKPFPGPFCIPVPLP
ncbi:MAG: hypothetical protein HY913_04850 [Desulfomonile tiedjei]|nr:hypothetical protein [Desulfomonile tiedjei]